jgi:hypothetical protein
VCEDNATYPIIKKNSPTLGERVRNPLLKKRSILSSASDLLRVILDDLSLLIAQFVPIVVRVAQDRVIRQTPLQPHQEEVG